MSEPKPNIECGTLPSYNLDDSDLEGGIEISAEQLIQMKEVEVKMYCDLMAGLQVRNEKLKRERDEAREIARELRDELIWKGKLVGLTRHQQALIAKAKKVLP